MQVLGAADRNKFECGYEVPQVLDGVTGLRLIQYPDGYLSLEMKITKNGPKAPTGEFTEHVWVPIPIYRDIVKVYEADDAQPNYDKHMIGYKFKESTRIADMKIGG